MKVGIWFVATVVMWSIVGFMERTMNNMVLHFWALLIAGLCTLILVIVSIKAVLRKD